MSGDRRTRAELQAELRLAKAESDVRAGEVAEKCNQEIKALRAWLDGRAPEAVAVDQCVKALDALKQAESNRSNTRNYSSPMYSRATSGEYIETRPLDAVGQVLAYLRIRFGHLDPQGEVEHLRQRVNQLVNENDRLREQLQQIARSAGTGMPL